VDMSSVELSERLRRASVSEILARVPEALRAYGVHGLRLSVGDDGTFRIVPEGLRNPFRPGVDIEGRGRIATGSRQGGRSVIEFEVGPDRPSIRRAGIVILVLIGLAVDNLLIMRPPNTFAWILFPFILAFVAWIGIQVRLLANRAGPGMLSVVKQILHHTDQARV
jgi:hypothetical protein